MAGFNEFMDKVGLLANRAAEKTKDLAAVAAEKTKQVSRVAKLNMDISAQRDTIKKAYMELGKLYYEAHRDDPDPVVAQVCGQITAANQAIASMEEEIARIKAESDSAQNAQDADFASVVDATAAEADVEVEVTVEEPAAPEAHVEPETPETPEEPETPEVPETPEDPEGPAEEAPHWD